MRASLAVRLGLSAPDHGSADSGQAGERDTGLMARSLMYLFVAGATLGLAPLLFPHGDGIDEYRILITSGCGYAMALVLLLGYDRLPPWAFQVFLAASTMLIEWSIYGSRDETSPYAAFYFWIAIYAFYFFTRVQAIVQIVFIVCAYAAVLAFVAEPTSAPVVRWAITTSALVVAGAMIGLLQERVARLARAVRHDTLTQLLNRRGFYELLDTDVERARRSGKPLTVVVGHIDDFKALSDELGGRALERMIVRLGTLLQDTKRDMDRAARLGDGEFALIVADADEHGAYILAERLRREVREAFDGEDVKFTLSFGLAAFPKHGATAEAVVHAAEQAVYASKQLGRDRSVIYSPEIAGIVLAAQGRRDGQGGGTLPAVLALAEVLDIRDGGTAEHSQTVGRFAEMIARRLDLPAELVKRIRIAGVLHDVGKIAIPDSVLRKPGPLTDEEWDEIRKHPEIGAMILDGADLRDIASWVRAHHERPDGRGYPLGLSGRDIPLEARILATADAYEAMIADRVYRPGMPATEAREELRRYAGTQFDERVVDVFCAALEEQDGVDGLASAVPAAA
jgi:diguanylate cyclase (GGDEF)-like protein/putative nucleotidyltransferase with HDIG domain